MRTDGCSEGGTDGGNNSDSAIAVTERAGSRLAWTTDLCVRVDKPTLVAFLREHAGIAPKLASLRMPKHELAQLLIDRLNADGELAERALDFLKVPLGVRPNELLEMLGCTATERRRWVDAKHIPVVGTQSFRGESRRIVYDVYDRRAVLAITPADIESWRAQDRAASHARRVAGGQRARMTRAERAEIRSRGWQAWQELQTEWLRVAGKDPLAMATLTLAHWTALASRWAKTHQEAQYETNARGARLRRWGRSAAAAKQWYSAKDAALQLLSRSPYTKVAFYRPGRGTADRRAVTFCEEHLQSFREERRFTGTNTRKFVDLYWHTLSRCPFCNVDVERDYYSLYVLKIVVPDLSDTFTFHLPYSIGRVYLPSPQALPRVHHHEQDEGYFRFGRPASYSERLTFPERAVAEQLALASGSLEATLVAFPQRATRLAREPQTAEQTAEQPVQE